MVVDDDVRARDGVDLGEVDGLGDRVSVFVNPSRFVRAVPWTVTGDAACHRLGGRDLEPDPVVPEVIPFGAEREDGSHDQDRVGAGADDDVAVVDAGQRVMCAQNDLARPGRAGGFQQQASHRGVVMGVAVVALS